MLNVRESAVNALSLVIGSALPGCSTDGGSSLASAVPHYSLLPALCPAGCCPEPKEAVQFLNDVRQDDAASPWHNDESSPEEAP